MSLECHLCDYKSEDKNALEGHIHGSHMKLFKAPTVKKCEHCNKSFLTNSGLEKHKSKCPLLVPFGVYKCAYCNLIFKNKKVIFRHTRDIHHFVIDTRKLKLDYSVKLTNDELNSPSFCTPAGRLAKSVPDNDSGIEFKCKVCRQLFKSRGCLKVHIYKEHNLRNSSRQKFPITDIWSCGNCNRTFYKKNTFTKHENYCSVDRSKPTKKSQPMIDYQQRMEKRRAIALEKFERELEKKMNKATIVNFALYGDVFVGASKYVDPDREAAGSSGITASTADVNNGSNNTSNVVVRDNCNIGIITDSVATTSTVFSDRRTIDKEDDYRTHPVSNDLYDGDDNDSFNCSYFNYQFFCPEVKCPKCSFICADRETLLKHQRKKHPKRNSVCEYCNNRFASLASLKSHKLKKHFVFEDARPDQKEAILKNRKGFYYTVKLFHCQSCTLSFSSNKVLQSHASTCVPPANLDSNRCSNNNGIINEATKKLMAIDNDRQSDTDANDDYYSGRENSVKSSEKDGSSMKRRMKELALILRKKPKLDCNSHQQTF